MSELVMPRLSDSMEEGTILRWLVDDGAEVTRGQEIVEIETDKATMPYEADEDGTLHIVAGEGTTLAIGAVIATIGEAGAPASAGGNGAAAAPAAPTAPAEQAPVEAPARERASATTADNGSGSGATGDGGGGRVKASPIARRIAREHDIDLHKLIGTGPAGRIVKADVLSAADAAPATPPAPAAAPPSPPPAPSPVPMSPAAPAGNKGQTTTVELNRTQQVIARRMAESRATVPSFEVSTDIDMTAARQLRTQLKAAADDDRQVVPSFNDMVVKACALALREHPRANGSYRDGTFELHSRINIGIAVAAQDALIVPTIFDADTRSLGDIARTTRTLAQHVRDNTIRPADLAGGTFTVSNLGMYGVTHFTAVINPPQAAILAVGAITDRATPHDGQITTRPIMTVTLACDHRILYGADAAQFLARIRELLEQPLTLAF